MEKSLNFRNRRIRITLHKDRVILAVCMSIAFVFWLFLKLSKTYSSETTFHIQYTLPDNLALTTSPPTQLQTTLSGRGWNLLALHLFGASPKVNFRVDDPSINGFSRAAILEKINQWKGNSQIGIEHIESDFIPVQADTLSQKKIPLRLNATIRLAEGYKLTNPITIQPDSIVITGAASLIKGIQQWETEETALDELKDDVYKTVAVKNPQNNELKLSPREVTIRATVEAITEKILYVPITITGRNTVEDSISLFPRQIQIKVNVGISQFNKIQSSDFQAIVNLADARNSADNHLPVTINKQPDSIQLLSFSPKSAEYFIIQKDTTAKESDKSF